MHTHSLDPWTHDHVFLGSGHAQNERRTWLVVALTAAMMVGEIAGGYFYGSLALVADGWHMSTHAAALGIAALAYLYSRRHRDDPRFTFGTGKLGDLAAFASAIALAFVALVIAYDSITRLAHPVTIFYREAIAIASLGLCVNLASAWLLRGDHDHDHAGNTHGHHHHHHHAHDHHHAHLRDNNLRAAYLHVLADAVTSLLAISGLAIAWHFGWVWIDPVVGLIGAGVIVSWAFTLIRDAGAVLLDTVPDRKLAADIRARLETGGDRVADLHLWQVGPGHRALVLSIVTDRPQPPAAYRDRLATLQGLSHVTVQVEHCPDHPHVEAA
ncbi:MAG TPA: CDF family Co(II)/Ni(II) efflux transporter DmeF [Pseudolabrys sp.]|nr:CDF family Co(II)/Ni(II) efflux transporter DmeF [Pseudolabrys sp.]